ncbi:prepilin peptidase [Actinokineospora xionganensis]|uniref:Prepilin peptidase n=1 Tax=Actinokineospora xionganensis TaxID=2684470 RepID=A0ABR7L8C8_9PSEU|nr:prepilin peptidase [Actinokineospora xionganensis]MBC6448567.1 prepilin peptidase [Actinokineospora xionganensis]
MLVKSTTRPIPVRIALFALPLFVLTPLMLNNFLGPPGPVILISVSATAGILAGMVARRFLARHPRGTRARAGCCEVPTAILWGLIAWRWHIGDLPTWWLPTAALYAWFAVSLAVVDFRERRVPDVITLAGYPVFGCTLTLAAVAVAASGHSWKPLVWNAILGATAFLAIHATIHLVHPPSLGAGDVKLSVPLGALLGAVDLIALPLALTLAAVITLALAVAAPRTLRTRWRSGIPHAPGMLAATALFVL